MALDTSLYKLLKDAPEIISDSFANMATIASRAIDCEGSPKQPKLWNQLINVGVLYEQVLQCVVLNGDGTMVTSIVGENVSVVNRLLIALKKSAEITSS